VVPALAFTVDGRLDLPTTRRYAEHAARTWIDVFLLSGSTTRGDLLTVADRATLIDLWLEVLPAGRLMACCWEPSDVTEAGARGVPAMAVMDHVSGRAQALDFFAGLPRNAFVYSHPMFGGAVLDADLAETAHTRGVLPAGGKIAKIPVGDVSQLRKATGPRFRLWDGSSRHIEASIRAGASGVVATPLSPLPTPFPDRHPTLVQRAVTGIQAELDALPTRATRTALLTARAREQLTSPTPPSFDGGPR